MKFSRLLKISLASVLNNKIRSFLTMLGIVIGISSVIIMLAIGEGTKNQVTGMIESLGTNLVTVNIIGGKTVAITDEEINELSNEPGIKEIAPILSQANINVKGGDKTSKTTFQASVPVYAKVRNIQVSDGRFINNMDQENRYKVVVIGTETAKNIFGTINVVGKSMYVNGVRFNIVGVIKTTGSSMMGSSDDRIIMPLSTAERLLTNTNIRTFYVEAEDKSKVSEAMSYLKLFFDEKYDNDTESYRIFDQTALLDTINNTTSSLETMLAGIAGISLIVGGIGIMNIMLVSVIERTREIGIRKAIGARRSTILIQFLIESMFVSGFGGVVGVIFGFIGSYGIQKFFEISVIISNNVVIISFLFSVCVGIVFGMYPANKASKLNPIEALRFE